MEALCPTFFFPFGNTRSTISLPYESTWWLEVRHCFIEKNGDHMRNDRRYALFFEQKPSEATASFDPEDFTWLQIEKSFFAPLPHLERI